MSGKHHNSCGHTSVYKALRPPKCLGGKGCAGCLAKWNAVQAHTAASPGRPVALPADVQRLVDSVRGQPVDFSDLCNRLDLSPARMQNLLKRAGDLGVRVHLEHAHVGLLVPAPSSVIHASGVEPVVGERQRVAVASDLHLGSKYHLGAQLRDFVEYVYKMGVRHILVPGDLLEGCYEHAIFEVCRSGLEDQAAFLAEELPRYPGLTYHAITGNHDFTYTSVSGVDVGRCVEDVFRRAGRHDIRFYGDRSAFLRILGAVVHLWHPKKGMSYARSYALQKQVEKYQSGEKPHILLAGHWHQYCHTFERGVHAVACPTFQGGGSAFAKSLGGAPAIGGLLLEWDLTKHGTMRDLRIEYRAYFEVERPQEVA